MPKKTTSSNKVFTTLGASNHITEERAAHDYYATDPKALEMLLGMEKFSEHVWECACGGGHLCEVLKKHGHDVKATDIVDRGYGGVEIKDFLEITRDEVVAEQQRDIITNPPYGIATECVQHALEVSNPDVKIAMLLRLQFLEGKARKALFAQFPPKKVYVSSSRLLCGKNGEFDSKESSAIAYAWFVWEKGYQGEPTLAWFN